MEAVLIIFQETFFFWWAMGDGGGLPRGFWNITSLTKDWTRAHGNKALSLNHWTTREFQYFRNVTINMGHQTTLHQTMILLYNSHLGTICCPHVHTHNTHSIRAIKMTKGHKRSETEQLFEQRRILENWIKPKHLRQTLREKTVASGDRGRYRMFQAEIMSHRKQRNRALKRERGD